MRCLLLTFDCLPRRWLGCYGSLDSTTRGFDRLAAEGMIFENAISADIRSEPASIAGFEARQAGGRTQIQAAGRAMPFASSVYASQNQPAAKSKSRRRAESHLSQDLHQASVWMREQAGSSLAWVRHPGLRLSHSEPISQDDVGPLLEQQGLIDEELDAFLDEWIDCADERWTFVLTSSRGVLRARSTQKRRTDATPMISDELARVPLLLLEGRGQGFGRRRLDLLSTSSVASAIASETSSSPMLLSERLQRLDAARFVTVQGDDGGIAVRTADWLFVRSKEPDREPGEGLLFRKPEDVSDVFDVRSLQADDAIRLDALIGA
jgi:hypothetical protein